MEGNSIEAILIKADFLCCTGKVWKKPADWTEDVEEGVKNDPFAVVGEVDELPDMGGLVLNIDDASFKTATEEDEEDR